MTHYTVFGTVKDAPELGSKVQVTVTMVEGPFPDDDEVKEYSIRKKTLEEISKVVG